VRSQRLKIEEETSLAKSLIHIHTGPDNLTKGVLGFLVAAAAGKEPGQMTSRLQATGSFESGKGSSTPSQF
jgi:hypothetical protein